MTLYDQWQGDTVWCVASGPSLTQADVDRLRGQRVIVVNSTVRLAPWADVLFAGDHGWWRENPGLWQPFRGVCATINLTAAREFGLTHIPRERSEGLCKTGLQIGGGSGVQAINLAYLMGAARICLLGYDMQATGGQTHWHGDHPTLANPTARSFKIMRRCLERMVRDIEAEGVPVVNCTRETVLSVPRETIDEALSRSSSNVYDQGIAS